MSSEESGIGESQKAFNTRILCLDSSLRSRMTGRYLLSFCKKRFFRFCSRLPLLSTCRLTLSPCPGTACVSYTFLLCTHLTS